MTYGPNGCVREHHLGPRCHTLEVSCIPTRSSSDTSLSVLHDQVDRTAHRARGRTAHCRGDARERGCAALGRQGGVSLKLFPFFSYVESRTCHAFPPCHSDPFFCVWQPGDALTLTTTLRTCPRRTTRGSVAARAVAAVAARARPLASPLPHK